MNPTNPNNQQSPPVSVSTPAAPSTINPPKEGFKWFKNSKKFLSVNLMPQELEASKKDKSNFYLVRNICIAIMLVFLSIAAIITGLTFYQGTRLKGAENRLKDIEGKILALKEREKLLFSLKQRISSIKDLVSEPAKSTDSFNFITDIIPTSVKIIQISIDKVGKVTFTGEVDDVDNLEFFFNDLAVPQEKNIRIARVDLENLSLAQDKKYRFEVVISLK